MSSMQPPDPPAGAPVANPSQDPGGQSERERFWSHNVYAVVGNSATRKFPLLTYRGLKRLGKTVYAIDPGAAKVDGDTTYPDFTVLPGTPEAAVLELPKAETAACVEQACAAGVKEIWIHQMTETPEALAAARAQGAHALTGTCAVMYVTPGFTMHAPHRWIMKLARKY
jgi:predicted CoA-binding protein